MAVNGPSRRYRDYEIGDCQCQRSDDEPPDDVPGRNIQTRKTLLEERRHKLNDRKDEAEHHKTGDDQWELRPLEWLAKPRANQNPSRQDDAEIPDPEQPPSKPAAENGPLRKPRYSVIQKGKESVAEKPEQDALRVVVAQASPGRPCCSPEEIRQHELRRHQDTEQDRDHHHRHGRDTVRSYKRFSASLVTHLRCLPC